MSELVWGRDLLLIHLNFISLHLTPSHSIWAHLSPSHFYRSYIRPIRPTSTLFHLSTSCPNALSLSTVRPSSQQTTKLQQESLIPKQWHTTSSKSRLTLVDLIDARACDIGLRQEWTKSENLRPKGYTILSFPLRTSSGKAMLASMHPNYRVPRLVLRCSLLFPLILLQWNTYKDTIHDNSSGYQDSQDPDSLTSLFGVAIYDTTIVQVEMQILLLELKQPQPLVKTYDSRLSSTNHLFRAPYCPILSLTFGGMHWKWFPSGERIWPSSNFQSLTDRKMNYLWASEDGSIA